MQAFPPSLECGIDPYWFITLHIPYIIFLASKDSLQVLSSSTKLASTLLSSLFLLNIFP